MAELKGVYEAIKKDGSLYYRASITYKNKHISLGSFDSEKEAAEAYQSASAVLSDQSFHYNDAPSKGLTFEKWITLHNFRDNGYYVKNPIYMHKYYFSYFLSPTYELEFDVDDLFYYSKHKIFQRNGYLFVNDFGIQTNILSRYGVRNFAVEGRDFYYKDGNPHNMRYDNIVVVNPYFGVEKVTTGNKLRYTAKIHILGNFMIGHFDSEVVAAIAYNKAADYLKYHHLSTKNFPRNYIDGLTKEQYQEIYQKIKLPPKITLRNK